MDRQHLCPFAPTPILKPLAQAPIQAPMAKAIRVGDKVTLPSGRAVLVTIEAVRDRPWAAFETGWVWHVCREHGREGHPLASYYFDPVRRTPLQLDEADAKATAAFLNRAKL